jgi:hypothetical protein
MIQDLRDIESRFLRATDVLHPQAPIPIWEMWGIILEHVPGVRGRRLYDEELNDVFKHAYEHASGKELWATCELAGLRWKFFDLLLRNRIGLRHVNEYEMMAASCWYTKLLDRLADVKPYRRTRRGAFIRRPDVSPSKHTWAH